MIILFSFSIQKKFFSILQLYEIFLVISYTFYRDENLKCYVNFQFKKIQVYQRVYAYRI